MTSEWHIRIRVGFILKMYRVRKNHVCDFKDTYG